MHRRIRPIRCAKGRQGKSPNGRKLPNEPNWLRSGPSLRPAGVETARRQLSHTASAAMASGTMGCAKTHFCQTKPIIMDKYLAIVSLWDKVLWR